MISHRNNLTPPPPSKIEVGSNSGPIDRSSAGLRDALFDEIDRLRDGRGDPKQALAVAMLARQILLTASLEYKLAKEGPPPKPLRLGRE